MVPGCEMPDVVVPDGPPLPIWRVLVVRDGEGAITIDAVEEIDVSSSVGIPLGPNHGAYALAALNAMGEPIDVQRIRFPTTRYFEGLDDTTGDEEDLSGQTVSVVGYLEVRDEADTLAVVDADGMIQNSIVAPAPGEAIRIEEGGSSPLIQAAPGGACAHVMILDTVEDARWNPTRFSHRPPSPTQLALVRAALGRMTAVHCMGVSRIAFIDRETGAPGSVASWEGDLINLKLGYRSARRGYEWAAFDDFSLQDDRARALFEGVIMHEAAHTTTNLLTEALREPGSEPNGIWAPTQRSMAEMTIERARMRGDFARLWGEMHDSFVDLGWADSYYEIPAREGEIVIEQQARIAARDAVFALRRDDPPDEIVAAGFMSPYGGLNPHEDIAEFATWPIAWSLYEAAGVPEGYGADRRGYACPRMSAHDSRGVPSGLAAPFTKMTFLRDLGFITERDYMRCVGSFLGLPNDTQGIEVYELGTLLNTFGNVPEARIEERSDRFVFVFEARGSAELDGMPYAALLTLEIDLGPTTRDGMPIPLEEVSWPRGAFRISPLTPHVFRLRLADQPAGNFDVTDGFVLAAASSNDRLVGSVFVSQSFRNMAPVPVPQTFDPPLQFRYLLEN